MNARIRLIALMAAGLAAFVVMGLIGAMLGGEATQRRAERQAAATPVAPSEDCPWGDASCVLALTIERALRRGDVEAVMGFTEPHFYICPGEAVADAPLPLCRGAARDTGLDGYPVRRRHSGESSVVDRERLQQRIADFLAAVDPRASDGVGGGELTLYAFGCPQRAVPFQNVSCARLAIILSAILGEGEEARRELMIFWAVGQFSGRTLPVTEVWDGPVLDEEAPVLFETGGNLPDLGEVYVIDQSLWEDPD